MVGNPPIVLVFAGHDPTGGAGVQADIEAIVACDAFPTTLITATTVQNTVRVFSCTSLDHGEVLKQAETLLADIEPQAVKIGLVASVGMVEIIAKIVDELPCPVILDPVLAAGGGGAEASSPVLEAIRRELIPRAYLCMPNSVEAKILTNKNTTNEQVKVLIGMGCNNILVTGTHDASTEMVVNRLYTEDGRCESWQWKRLPDSYHGSGCTLASASAALIAKNQDPLPELLRKAQQFTWNALNGGFKPGGGQLIPSRRSSCL
jgi:hydroxymethylpyrimidine/phosphomethylpyrimidine kinase